VLSVRDKFHLERLKFGWECLNCYYFEPVSPEPCGICHRSPDCKSVTIDDWCGEFRSVDQYVGDLERLLPRAGVSGHEGGINNKTDTD